MSISRRRSRSQSSTPNNSPRPPPLSGLPIWNYTPLSERMTTSTPPTPSAAPFSIEFYPSSRPAVSSSTTTTTTYSLFGGELNQENLVRLHREAYVSLRRSVAESDDSFVERMRNWEKTRSRIAGIGNEGSASHTDGTGAAVVDPHAQNQYHNRSHKRRKTAPSETRLLPLDDFSHRHSHARQSQSSSHVARRHRWPRLPQTRRQRGFESDADSSSTPDDDEEYRAASIPSSRRDAALTWDEDAASGHSDMMDVEGSATSAPALSMSMSSGSSVSLPYAEPLAREDKAVEELSLAMAAGSGSIEDYEDVRKAQGELEEVDAGALWD